MSDYIDKKLLLADITGEMVKWEKQRFYSRPSTPDMIEALARLNTLAGYRLKITMGSFDVDTPTPDKEEAND